MTEDVHVVVVNWNTRDLLHTCLSSVRSEHLSIAITVVDNASSDGSIEMIRKEFPTVRLIQNHTNVGFIRANNQVLPHVTSQAVLLLNPDARLHEGCIDALFSFLSTHPQCGAVGPRVHHPQGQLRVLHAGREPTLWRLFTHYFFLSRWSRRHAWLEGVNMLQGVHDDKPRRVEWLGGACLMVKRSVIRKVGVLDEGWFMYADDIEWCTRMIDAGYEIWHLPTAQAEHFVAVTHDMNPTLSTMWLTSMRSYYARRHRAGPVRLLAFNMIVSVGFTLRSVAYMLLAVIRPASSRTLLSMARRSMKYARAPLSRDG